MLDDNLKQFATPRQIEYIEAVNEHGSLRKAAIALGVCKGTVQNSIDIVKRKAARQGFSPEHDMTHIAPDPFLVKGISTYYNKDGKPTGQWVKTSIDNQKLELILQETIAALKDDIPRVNPIQSDRKSVV